MQDAFLREFEGLKQHTREMQAKQNQMSSLSQPSLTYGMGQGVSSNVGAGMETGMISGMETGMVTGMGTGMITGMGTRSESNASSMPFSNHEGNYNILYCMRRNFRGTKLSRFSRNAWSSVEVYSVNYYGTHHYVV